MSREVTIEPDEEPSSDEPRDGPHRERRWAPPDPPYAPPVPVEPEEGEDPPDSDDEGRDEPGDIWVPTDDDWKEPEEEEWAPTD